MDSRTPNKVTLFVATFIANVCCTTSQLLNIGAIVSHPEPDGVTIQIALDYINEHSTLLPRTTLAAHVEYIHPQAELDKLKHIQKACSLIEKGIVGAVGPISSTSVKVTQPIFSGFHVPQVAPSATDPTLSVSSWDFPYLLKMSPMDTYQSLAVVDLVRTFGWTRVATLTSNSDYGRQGLQEFHRQALANKWIILRIETFSVHPDLANINATEQLINIKKSGARVIILNSEELPAWIVLGQAKAQGMFAKGWSWIVTDAISIRNNTSISDDGPQIVSGDCISLATEFEGLIGTVVSADDEQPVYKDFLEKWRDAYGADALPPVHARLLFDSVLAIAYGIHDYLAAGNVLRQPAAAKPGICSANYSAPWSNGSALLEHLIQVQGSGASHYINFTENNLPGWRRYDILNLKASGWEKVSEWQPEIEGSGLPMNNQVLFPGRTYDIPEDFDMEMSTLFLRVTTILEKPFAMIHEKTGILHGMCVDLVKRLAEEMKFGYEIQLVKDNAYGGFNKDTLEWNGMIREILDGEADIAVAPLFITKERADYVEFTKPWYDLGLDILLPLEESSTNLFDFFDPFELPLWIAVIVSTYICGFVVSTCSFLSPFGFKGKYIQRQRKNDHKYRDRKNELNANNGIWFAFSSLMRQGPSTTPISVSGRIVSGFWWLAVTILTATYTANLTAHLTVERLDSGVSSLMELSAQTEIKYGTINGTAVEAFFEENKADPFPRMYQFMNAYNNWMPNGSAAIQRVQQSIHNKKDKYAFIFDSTILEYAAKNEPCTTRTLGDIFRRAGYGIAMRKKSPLVRNFDSAILKLRENGEIEALVNKWMQGPCIQQIDSSTQGEQMTLMRMLGLFFVLASGLVLGLILILVEYTFAGYRDVVEDRLQGRLPKSWWFHVKRRLLETRDELQEMFCISPCCRQAYSLNDSRRFSAQFLSFTGRTQESEPKRKHYNGTSRARSLNAKRRNSASPRGNSNVVFKKQRPIFNTHDHIMELCRAADIPMNGINHNSGLKRTESEEDEDDSLSNGMIQSASTTELLDNINNTEVGVEGEDAVVV